MIYTADAQQSTGAGPSRLEIEAASFAEAIAEADKWVEAHWRNEAYIDLKAPDWAPLSDGKRYIARNQHGRSVGEVC